MATLGHVAIGIAAAQVGLPEAGSWRERVGAGALLSAVALAPDADVIAFALGVPYHAPWGHRGAAHSLLVTFAAGALIGLAVRWRRRGRGRFALAAAVAAATHGVLDTLTDGGLGIALLWPFTNERFFAPWQPIPVAPIGTAFLSPRGLSIALFELALFSPLVLFALWPRRWWRRPRAACSGAE